MPRELEGEIMKKLQDVLPDYPEFLEQYLQKIKKLDRFKRKRVSLSLATPTIEAIKWFSQYIKDEDGNSIPISYIIEDLVTWVFSDPLVLYAFLSIMYSEEE